MTCIVCISLKEEWYRIFLFIETFFHFFLNVFKTDWMELRPYYLTCCLHIYLRNCNIENFLLLKSPPPPATAFFEKISWHPAPNQAREKKTENILRSNVQANKTFDVILIINQTVVNLFLSTYSLSMKIFGTVCQVKFEICLSI